MIRAVALLLAVLLAAPALAAPPAPGIYTLIADGMSNRDPDFFQRQDGALCFVYHRGIGVDWPYTQSGAIYQKCSTDQGNTWSAGVPIYVPTGGNIAVDTAAMTLRDGRCVVSYFDNPLGQCSSCQLVGGAIGHVIRSLDATCTTWHAPSPPIPYGCSWSALTGPAVELANGTLVQVTYDNCGGFSTSSFGVSYAWLSYDKGDSWAGRVEIGRGAPGWEYDEPYAQLYNNMLFAFVRVEGFVMSQSSSLHVNANALADGVTWGATQYVFGQDWDNAQNNLNQMQSRPAWRPLSDGNLVLSGRDREWSAGQCPSTGWGNCGQVFARLCHAVGTSIICNAPYQVDPRFMNMQYSSNWELAPGIIGVVYGYWDSEGGRGSTCPGNLPACTELYLAVFPETNLPGATTPGPTPTPIPGQVYIIGLAGQSNMRGNGVLPSPADTSSSQLAVFGNDYRYKCTGALGLTTCNDQGNPVEPFDDTYLTQVDTVSNDGAPDALYGPGQSIGMTIINDRTSHHRYVFVPCALGGTHITQWLPQGGGHDDRTTLYGSCHHRLAQVAADTGGTVVGIAYSQGESDTSNITFATNWATNFTTLVAAWKADFPTLGGICFAELENLPIDYGPYQATIRNAQHSLSLPNVSMIPVYDLSLQSGMIQADGLHLTTAALRITGQEFGHCLEQYVPDANAGPIPTATAFRSPTPCPTCTPPIGSPLGSIGSCPGGFGCCSPLVPAPGSGS